MTLLREKMRRHDDVRGLVRALFASTINLRPDVTGTELRSERHGPGTSRPTRSANTSAPNSTAPKPTNPGITPRRHFTALRSSTFRRVQEV